MKRLCVVLIWLLAINVPLGLHAARPVPFTVDELMGILEIKGWKYERLFREPIKGVTVSIILGSTSPDGSVMEKQIRNPFGYQPPSRQTRFVVGVVVSEARRVFRIMIDDMIAEIDMPPDFKYAYDQGFINGVEDGELLILAFNAKDPSKATKSKHDMTSYFAIKVTPTR